MPNPGSTADRPIRPRLPLWRRLCRWSVFALLILLNLLLLAFLLRRPLFEGFLRDLAGRELSAALAAEVTVGSIGGSWLASLEIEGIQLRGRPEDLLREVQGLSVHARFSLWDLLHGDLSGLRAARVRAQRVVLETTGRPPGSTTAGGPAAPFDFSMLAALLPRGAEVHVASLDFGSGSRRREGLLHLVLEPGTGTRHLKVGHGSLLCELDLSLPSGTSPTLAGSVRTADAAQLAACFGALPQGFSGGNAYLHASVTLAPLRVSAHGVLDGLRAERAELQRSVFSLTLDETTLSVPQATLDLHGLHVQADRFVVPSPIGGRPLHIAAASGQVDVRIDDLEPWRDLLPKDLTALLPVTGRVHARIDRGLLHVDECRLLSRGASLVVDRGVLPIDDSRDLADRALELGFALHLPVERAFAVEGTRASATGRIDGRVAGSLRAPRVQGKIHLSQAACEYGTAGEVRGSVSFADSVIHVRELVAQGITVAGGTEPSRVQGEVRIALAKAGRPLALTASVSGMAHPGLFAIAGLEPTRAPRIEPFHFTVAGGITIAGTAMPSGKARVELRDVVVENLPAASLDAEVTLADEVLHIRSCHLLAPASLDLRGSLPLAGHGELDLVLEAPDQDLAFWTSLLTKEQLAGKLSVHGRARGTLAQPQLELQAAGMLTATGSLLTRWPEALGDRPQAPIGIRLRASQGESCIEVDELVLASSADAPSAFAVKAHGSVPWLCGLGAPVLRTAPRPLTVAVQAYGTGVPGRDLPWRLQTTFALDAQETRVDELRIETGPGGLRGSGTLAAGWAQAFTPDAIAAAKIDARAQMDDLRLEALPTALAGIAVAEGTLRGAATLGGTLARPEPVVTLELEQAQVRVPGAPRLTELSGTIRGDLGRLEVQGLRARMGAGPIALDATFTSKDGWTDRDAISVQAHLTGTQALIVNTPTLRVRGDADLTASGTVGKCLVKGTIDLTSGRFAQRVTAVPSPGSLRMRGGAGTAEGFELNLLEPPFGQRIELDIAVRTRRNFEVRTHLFDADLDLDLHVRGDASQARLVGNVAGSKGTLRLPGTTMQLRSLLFTFAEEDPLHPKLQLLAEGRRHGYRVHLDLHGTPSAPEFVLTSTPPLPAEELLVLITTGALPDRLREQGTRGQATLVGAYLAEELASWYLGGEGLESHDSIFDRFSVETGRELSDKGLETVLVEFRLNDRFSLQGERDVYEDINGGISIRWRFR